MTTLTAANVQAFAAGAQNQSVIVAAETVWNASTKDQAALNNTAIAAASAINSVDLVVQALRAVSAGAGFGAAQLSAALMAANASWGQAQCDCVAGNAMKNFYGLYPRRFFGDMSSVPAVPADNVLITPDIVCTGTSPLTDPNSLFTTWNVETFQSPQATRANFIYVRGMNLFPGSEQGKVYLYVGNMSVIHNPAQWTQLKTVSSTGFANIQMSGNTGNLWLGDQAFSWTPPDTQHYCFITRVETDYAPNPLPGSVADPPDWVHNTPAVAWRNVDPITALRGPRAYALGYGNTHNEVADFHLVAYARNIPPGVSVRINSLAGPAFDTGVTAITGKRQEVVASFQLPPGFSEKFSVTIDNQSGRDIPANAYIDVRCYRRRPAGHPVPGAKPHALGIRAPLPLQENETLGLCGSFAFTGGKA